VGDTVIIKGEVVKVLDDPGYINCTVKLTQQMPPSGAETMVQCNTAQLEKQGGGSGGKGGAAEKSQSQPPPQPPPQQAPPQHAGKK